jgi:FAD/FMN-containing dehydrogenase
VSTDALAGELARVVGAAHVLQDPDLRAPYETDWTRRFHGTARLVVRPADARQVVEVVRRCAAHAAAIVPQGGNTGLVGGGVPRQGEVVLSLARLDDMGPVEGGQVTVGAGATLGAVQRHAADAGWEFGVDLAARDSATIGGMVATNAGGTQVIRHGTMRAQVLGVEAVLADGGVMRRLGGLVKDNTGYDLAGLLCGSEGTLGIVTRARLRLVPRLPHRVTVLLGAPDVAAAQRLLGAVRAAGVPLDAVEWFRSEGVRLVREHAGLGPPPCGEHPDYVLLEASDRTDPTEQLAEVLSGLPEAAHAAVAVDPPDRRALWAYRERHTEAINAVGVPHKLDVTLPAPVFAGAVTALPSVVSGVDPAAVTVLFGHLGDGNVHVNVLGPAADDERVDEAVLRHVAAAGGSISAEHGIGTAKARWLSLSRSEAEIAAMRAIKAALDPAGMLNPGVLLAP